MVGYDMVLVVYRPIDNHLSMVRAQASPGIDTNLRQGKLDNE